MSFESLGLGTEIRQALSEKGYTTPTPIQTQAIPPILDGRDVLGSAQTGTGKTASFTLPILHRLMSSHVENKKPRAIRALVITPTRELATQVAESVHIYSKHLPLSSMVVFGGVKIERQIEKLRRDTDILVATPGRLLDHLRQKTVDLSKVEILVLDEADRMLDMQFIRDIRKLVAQLPTNRQTLLFSATFSDEIKKLSDKLLNAPVLIEVAQQNIASEQVNQIAHPVDRARKRELLRHLITSNHWQQVLVFTRTKQAADKLTKQLIADGLASAAIHGDWSQSARTKALLRFKSGELRVLVATDIAARGLDIHQFPHVVNFELPHSAEDYIHRIGRTGRADNTGEATSLVCVDELKLLNDIEQLIKRDIPSITIDGHEPDPSIKAQPIQYRPSRKK